MDWSNPQTLLTGVAAVLLSGAALGGAWNGVRALRTVQIRRVRLSEPGAAPGEKPPAADLLRPVVDAVQRMGDRIAVRDPGQISALRAKLIQSGFMGREAVAIYLGARFACLAGATGLAVMILPWAVAKGGGLLAMTAAVVPAILAILGPDKVLSARRRARELEYRDGFPDFLDLLVASVEAGLSLDAAVSRVSDEIGRRHPNLAAHVRGLTLELRAGRARRDAWTGFAERLGIDEARSLATMLRQAEEMGTSLGETLAIFSTDMRQKRMLRAEEKAMALPAKLMIPLILFIFPCLLGVLILPAAFHISQTLMK